MSNKAALAFATGFGGGYMGGKRQAALDEERKADRQMRQDEHDARRRESQRQEGDRISLANAARPVTVEEGANGAIKLDSADNRDVDGTPATISNAGAYRVNGQTYADRGGADAAAAQANTPEAQDQRISLAMKERGNVVGAKQYEASARQSQLAAAELADKVWNREIREAMPKGHQGIADFLSRTQVGPLKGVEVKAIPNQDGKTVTYHMVNPDGTTTPKPDLTFTNDQTGVIKAGYQLAHVDPEVRYRHMVEEDKQAAVVSAKEKELDLRKRQLEEVQIPNAETRAQLAQVQAQLAEVRAARAGGKGSDGVSREERLRYTTLYTDAGRRMQDVSKSLNTLRADRSFMRRAATAGTPEAQQLSEMQEQLTNHKQERELYQGLLAGGTQAGGKQPALADAEPKVPVAKPPTPKQDQATARAAVKAAPKSDYSQLWK